MLPRNDVKNVQRRGIGISSEFHLKLFQREAGRKFR